MTSITVDAATAAKLAEAKGKVQLCDEAGKVLGWYDPRPAEREQQPTVEQLIESCPSTDAELDEISNCGEGKTLKEILGDLGAV